MYLVEAEHGDLFGGEHIVFVEQIQEPSLAGISDGVRLLSLMFGNGRAAVNSSKASLYSRTALRPLTANPDGTLTLSRSVAPTATLSC